MNDQEQNEKANKVFSYPEPLQVITVQTVGN